MAPEYAMRGYLTNKADVYSFGVVALEIVSGKSNTNYRPKEDFVYLLDWVCIHLFFIDSTTPYQLPLPTITICRSGLRSPREGQSTRASRPGSRIRILIRRGDGAPQRGSAVHQRGPDSEANHVPSGEHARGSNRGAGSAVGSGILDCRLQVQGHKKPLLAAP